MHHAVVFIDDRTVLVHCTLVTIERAGVWVWREGLVKPFYPTMDVDFDSNAASEAEVWQVRRRCVGRTGRQ